MLSGEVIRAETGILASDAVQVLCASEKSSLQTQQSRNQRSPKGRCCKTQGNQAGPPGTSIFSLQSQRSKGHRENTASGVKCAERRSCPRSGPLPAASRSLSEK